MRTKPTPTAGVVVARGPRHQDPGRPGPPRHEDGIGHDRRSPPLQPSLVQASASGHHRGVGLSLVGCHPLGARCRCRARAHRPERWAARGHDLGRSVDRVAAPSTGARAAQRDRCRDRSRTVAREGPRPDRSARLPTRQRTTPPPNSNAASKRSKPAPTSPALSPGRSGPPLPTGRRGRPCPYGSPRVAGTPTR